MEPKEKFDLYKFHKNTAKLPRLTLKWGLPAKTCFFLLPEKLKGISVEAVFSSLIQIRNGTKGFWPVPMIQDQILLCEWKTYSCSWLLQISGESLARHVWCRKGTMCAWVKWCWTGVEFDNRGIKGHTGFKLKTSSLLLRFLWRDWITKVRPKKEIKPHFYLWRWISLYLYQYSRINIDVENTNADEGTDVRRWN